MSSSWAEWAALWTRFNAISQTSGWTWLNRVEHLSKVSVINPPYRIFFSWTWLKIQAQILHPVSQKGIQHHLHFRDWFQVQNRNFPSMKHTSWGEWSMSPLPNFHEFVTLTLNQRANWTSAPNREKSIITFEPSKYLALSTPSPPPPGRIIPQSILPSPPTMLTSRPIGFIYLFVSPPHQTSSENLSTAFHFHSKRSSQWTISIISIKHFKWAL